MLFEGYRGERTEEVRAQRNDFTLQERRKRWSFVPGQGFNEGDFGSQTTEGWQQCLALLASQISVYGGGGSD